MKVQQQNVRVKEIFNEDEFNKFRREANIGNNQESSFNHQSYGGYNQLNNFNELSMDKNKIKSVILRLLKSKVKEPYMISALSWLETELEEEKKIKNENEELKKALLWIDKNCTLKLNNSNQDFINSNYNRKGQELSISQIKNHLNRQNKIGKDSLNKINKPEQFITFSEDTISKIETQEFNIFQLEKEVGQENTLSVVSCYIFTNYGLYSIINYNKFEKFVQEITKGYIRENPYHNVRLYL